MSHRSSAGQAVLISYGLIVVLTGISAAVAFAAAWYAPSNHWGLVDIRWCLALAPPALLWLALASSSGWIPKHLRLILAVSVLMLVGSILVADQCNLLVEYHVWVRRGMPARWERP